MPDRNELIVQLYNIRQQAHELGKAEKGVLAQLKPLVDWEFDVHGDLGLPVSETVIHAGGIDLSRQSGSTHSISADMLQAQGVSLDVIARATKTTTYFKYLTKKAKD